MELITHAQPSGTVFLIRFTGRHTIRDKGRFSAMQQRGELHHRHAGHNQTQAEPLKGGQYATQEKEGEQCRHDRFEGVKDTGDRSCEVAQAHRK
jgi:hypothetical protein